MKHTPDTALVEAVEEMAYSLEETSADYDPLMDLVGNAQLVLLGESTHGTHEFYKERAAITRRLILENQFDAIAVEARQADIAQDDLRPARLDERDSGDTVEG